MNVKKWRRKRNWKKTTQHLWARLETEALEQRILLRSEWQNSSHPLNVDNDPLGEVTLADAEAIIAELHDFQFADPGTGQLPEIPAQPVTHFVDVDGDGFVSPVDLVQVFNGLNQAPQLDARLANDTARGGTTNNDRLTSDPSIAGTVSDDQTPLNELQLTAQLDGGPEIDVTINSDGTFRFLPPLGVDGSDDGSHSVTFRMSDPQLGTRTSLVDFVLDTQAPALTLRAAADDPQFPSAHVTTAASDLALAGTVDDTVPVELYRGQLSNADRIDSTNPAGDGSFEFPAVSLSAIDNYFVALAEDAAGNIGTADLGITQIPCDPAEQLAQFTVPSTHLPAIGSDIRRMLASEAEFVGILDWQDRTDQQVALLFRPESLWPDVVTITGESQVSVFQANSAGMLSQAVELPTGGQGATALLIGDFVGDARPDIAVGHDDGQVQFLSQDEQGAFVLSATSVAGLGSIVDLASGDFDYDGDLDLAVAASDKVTVLYRDDALVTNSAIVNGDFRQALTGWTTEITGHKSERPGTASARDGRLRLTENGSFLTSVSQTFIVPAEPGELTFDLLDVALGSFEGAIPDVLEVSLLGAEQNSLVETFRTEATSFLNVAADGTFHAAAGVSLDGHEISVDISMLTPGSEATLYFDLIGNEESQVAMAVIDNVVVSPSFLTRDGFRAETIAADLDDITAITTCHLGDDPYLDLLVRQQESPLLSTFENTLGTGFTADGGQNPGRLAGMATPTKSGTNGLPVKGNSQPQVRPKGIPVDLLKIPLGEPISGETTTPDQMDGYTFSAEEGDHLYFDALATSISHRWSLYSPSEAIIFDSFLQDFELNSAPETGVYTLVVMPFQERLGPYEFTIHLVPEREPQDIQYGEVVSDEFEIPGDMHIYTFAGLAGERIFIDEIEGTIVGETAVLTGPGGGEVFVGPLNDQGPIGLPESGTYSLFVDGRNDHVGPFSFSLEVVPEDSITLLTLNQRVISDLRQIGETDRYQIQIDESTQLYFDVHNPHFVYEWRFTAPDGSDLFNTIFTDMGPILVEEPGLYELAIFEGDATGPYEFTVWDVPLADTRQIAIGEIVTDATTLPGEQKVYEFEAAAGDPLNFDLLYPSAFLFFELFAPSGNRIWNRNSDIFVDELPETGTYQLIAQRPSGLGAQEMTFAFRLIESEMPPELPPTPDLEIRILESPIRVVGDPAEVTLTWEITNTGEVSVPAGTEIVDQIHLSENPRKDPLADDPLLVEFFHEIETELAPGDSFLRTESFSMPAGLNGELWLFVTIDARNKVFEGDEESDVDNNQAISQRLAVYPAERELQGEANLSLNVEDGASFSAGTTLTLNGEASPFQGPVNLVFVIDVSSSTSHVTDLDANRDGVIDEGDNINRDERLGDVLDVGIGAALQLTERYTSLTSDLLVSAIAFGGTDDFGRGEDESVPLDLGTPAYNQSFQNPLEDGNDNQTPDFEESLRTLEFFDGGFLNTYSRASLFRPIRLGQGNNLNRAIEVLIEQLSRRPLANQTHVYLITDTGPSAEVDVTDENLARLAAQGITWFGAQITGEAFSEPLQRATDRINASAESTGTAFLVNDPNALTGELFESVELAGVLINGQAVDTLDPAGNFFSTVTLAEGENHFTFDVVDALGNVTTREITLIGTPLNVEPAWNSYSDVSNDVALDYSFATFNRRESILYADLTAINEGDTNLRGPLAVSFTDISPPSVTVPDAELFDENGRPTLQLDPAEGGNFAPGAASETVLVSFANPELSRFTFDTLIRTPGNAAPIIGSSPIIEAAPNQEYEYNVQATDANNDTLTYSLTSAPSGMTIDADTGHLRWTPAASDLGTHSISVEVTDGFGGTATQSFQLSVETTSANRPPVFASIPVLQVMPGDDYSYQALANDPDRDDTVTYSLATGPDGLTVDAATGLVTWPDPQEGDVAITLRAADQSGLYAEQSYVLHVGDLQPERGIPRIVSTPPLEATLGETYRYQVLGFDDDGDPLTWSLPLAPAGMTIDPARGTMIWTPTADQLGDHTVLVRLEDGDGAATQLFSVQVASERANQAPIFTSRPQMRAEVDIPLTEALTALDPDGDALKFMLQSGPDGFTVNAESGQITFTPTTDQLGRHFVEIHATDPAGAAAILTYELHVLPPNVAPVFITEPVIAVTAGNLYRYEAAAFDEFDALTYELLVAPAGMNVEPHRGVVTWPTDAFHIGDHPVHLRVIDSRGASADQMYSLGVTADTEAPEVSILLSSNLADIGDTTFIELFASDNVAVVSRTLTLDGEPIELDADNSAEFTPPAPGLYQFTATATDAAGNVGTDTKTLRVFDPSDTEFPFVEITSPANNTEVNYLVDIIGTVTDENLEFYRVQYARFSEVDYEAENQTFDDPGWTTIHEGFENIENGVLATFDPTHLDNDIYALRVIARDINGEGWTQPHLIQVTGEAKLGRFQFDTLDLSIPLAGIPIEITRRYDSFRADLSSDFGHGWSLAIASADIREDVPLPARGAASNLFNANPFLYGSRVYLTTPDGRRAGFTFEPTQRAGFIGAIFEPRFIPDPGVEWDLEVENISLTQHDDGTFGLYLFGFPYNPDTYTLISRDGIRYTYDQFASPDLQQIEDRNGNTILFDDTGIHSSLGPEILWNRDELGRITRVTDPAGNEIAYAYSTSGNLSSVTDQVGNATQYAYLDDPEHYLRSIVDPRGVEVLSLQYDENGRLTARADADGNIANLTYDVADNRETISDFRGNVTTLVFNDLGNITEEIDALGNTTFREYADPQNPYSETRIVDRRGFVTEQEFDVRGNLTRIAELGHRDAPFSEPIVTRFTYNDNNDVTSITDARGNTTQLRYDGINLVEVINALSDSAHLSYFENGDVEAFTDFNGNLTAFSDYVGGQPGLITFGDGTQQRLAYNQFGQVTYEAFLEPDGTIAFERRARYDAAGRLVEETVGSDIDASETMRRLFYDGNLLDWEIVVHPDSLDENGNLLESPATPVNERLSSITDYVYDVSGRVITQIDAEGGVIDFRYDEQGNRIALRDPVGNVTTWIFDALNRPIEERDPLYWEAVRQSTPEFATLTSDEFLDRVAPLAATAGFDPLYDDPSGASCETMTGAEHVILTCYDAEGNASMIIDRNGRRREFSYEFDGELNEERWYDAAGEVIRTFTYEYDETRNLIAASDPDSSYVFTYDVLNRLTTADNAGTPDIPHVVLEYGYDAQGNETLVADSFGVTVASTYNERNLLANRAWFDAHIGDGETAEVDSLSIAFRYTALGRKRELRRFSDTIGEELVGIVTRGYDLAGRSQSITFANATGDILADYQFRYDVLGSMAESGRAGVTAVYTHDLTGQLLSAVRSNGNDEFFSYDANGNRTLPGYVTGTGNRLLSDGRFTYEYDGEGNRISKTEIETGKVTRYEYDHRNRLVRVTEQEAGGEEVEIAAFTYDAMDRRIVIRTAEGITMTVHDGEQAWVDFDEAGKVTARYLYDDEIDMLLAMATVDRHTVFMNTTHLGSVVGHVSIDGEFHDNITYQAFGRPIEFMPSAERFTFTGRELHRETVLYANRARYYDPSIGRFISSDPLGFGSYDANLFRYASNNPLLARDPTGLIATSVIAALATESSYVAGLVGGFSSSFADFTLEFTSQALSRLDILQAFGVQSFVEFLTFVAEATIVRVLERIAILKSRLSFNTPAAVGFEVGSALGLQASTAILANFIVPRS